MAQETEIKLKIEDKTGFLRKLKRIGARTTGAGDGRVHQRNVIFDTPQGALAKHGQLLRIRTETATGRKAKKSTRQRVLLTFKQPPTRPPGQPVGGGRRGHHKVREEFEMEIASVDTLARIFEGLGMSGWFQYEKFPTTFRLSASQGWARELLIELDETPIGIFAELEGPGKAIDRAAQLLGFSKRDYILKNYLVLYVEECRRRGEQPTHMLFEKNKTGLKSSAAQK